MFIFFFFFFSSRRRHTRSLRDWSSDVCSSDLFAGFLPIVFAHTAVPARLAKAARPLSKRRAFGAALPQSEGGVKPAAASGGQGEADRGAAGGGIVAGVDRASVGPDQIAGDGQPQTAALGATR